jgi:hypothetical protein
MAGSAERRSNRNAKLETPSQANVSDAKKPAPISTRKRLPWLDGKSSQTVSSTGSVRKSGVIPRPVTASPKRPEITQAKPSPLSKSALPSIPKTAKPTGSAPTIILADSAPVLPRRSLITPTERRVLSMGAATPNPVLNRTLTQHRRDSVHRKNSSPLRDTKTPKLSLSSKRRSAVLISEPIGIDGSLPDQEQTPFGDPTSRRGSIAAITPHLERFTTPNSFQPTIQRNFLTPSPPLQVIRSAEISPSHPKPNKTPFENVNTRKTSNAIEGLEDMVQEAVDIIEDTKSQDQVEEIYEIIEAATNSIQQVSVAPIQRLMETSSPLEVSGSSEAEISSYESSDETPIVPKKASFVARQGSMLCNPSRLQQRGYNAIDWAYQNSLDLADRPPTPSLASSYTNSDLNERGRSRYSTRSDLLLPPQPAQTAPRDHVDFVIRPLVARSHSRGRSRRRKGSSFECGARRRHRRSFRNSEDNSRHRSRSCRHQSSSYSQNDPSFDEEDIHIRRHRLSGLRQNKHELSVREQVHHHTFGIHRNHRRQPIARNWSSGKKRITATIACINTALLGIIIGIYVSSSCIKCPTMLLIRAKAGEVPRIQYMLADERHHVVVGNVV